MLIILQEMEYVLFQSYSHFSCMFWILPYSISSRMIIYIYIHNIIILYHNYIYIYNMYILYICIFKFVYIYLYIHCDYICIYSYIYVCVKYNVYLHMLHQSPHRRCRHGRPPSCSETPAAAIRRFPHLARAWRSSSPFWERFWRSFGGETMVNHHF